MHNDEVMGIKEVSEFLKTGTTTIYALARKKKIPARKIGREWKFLKSEIMEWMEEEHSKE